MIEKLIEMVTKKHTCTVEIGINKDKAMASRGTFRIDAGMHTAYCFKISTGLLDLLAADRL